MLKRLEILLAAEGLAFAGAAGANYTVTVNSIGPERGRQEDRPRLKAAVALALPAA